MTQAQEKLKADAKSQCGDGQLVKIGEEKEYLQAYRGVAEGIYYCVK